ncbi:hypothetical protein MNV_1230020 [Candidatus Methanoperedens nitroreducens]|uniref:Uncharacterized protein n=1 Tax=Candidatus Methanoperedens nitratireducens TaxID=1392998 RepID=A0A284VK49_9EURY|nr:hypothetical protein MNV_1230020 [Candidatus Methanoperedens nitroreducens]
MVSKALKKELLKKCKSLGIPLVGFAPVERWQNRPGSFRTGSRPGFRKSSGRSPFIQKQKP